MAANHPNRSKNRAVSSTSAAPRNRLPPRAQRDAEYDAVLQHLGASFHALAGTEKRLFRTDANPDDLWAAYLGTFRTDAERQHHDCHCCRRFIQRFGGLVAIDEAGNSRPAMWWNHIQTPGIYAEAFGEMNAIVSSAKVTGVFLTGKQTWGSPRTEEWEHLAVVPPAALVYRGQVLNAEQAAAAVAHNVATVATALGEYSPAVIDQALRLLEADAVTRAEKFVGPAGWLRGLQIRPKGRKGHNLLWKAVATAPDGYCHVKGTVLGGLYDDIIAGLPTDDIRRRFAAKMDPRDYQRPKAAPAAQNVLAAERTVEKLGIAKSLERRFARLDDLPVECMIWRPVQSRAAASSSGTGVFGHIKTKQPGPTVKPVDLPPVVMTWEKFLRDVVPSANRIEAMVPPSAAFFALVTAVDPDAPPILKWDRPEWRNPVSSYTYTSKTSAHSWKLAASTYVPVTAIVPSPNSWGPNAMDFLHVSATILLEGCADTRTSQGAALFPEDLVSELYGSRATIEAFSKSARISGHDRASACGLGVQKGDKAIGYHLRAQVGAGEYWNHYTIDRWD